MSKGTKIITSAVAVFENLASQLANGVKTCEAEKTVLTAKKVKATENKDNKVAKIVAETDRKIAKVTESYSNTVAQVAYEEAEIDENVAKAKRVIANLEKLTQ